MKFKTPFNKPFVISKELDYITQAVQNGHLSGNGIFTRKCHAWMENKFEANKVLLTHSCTAALEMAAILADVQPGDEVILPSYTFVSTANAFVLRGAVLVWCDIRSDTLNIDESKIEALITPRTKVIIPVHYAGVACEMDIIMKIAAQYNLLVIEDAAQAVNAKYNNSYLGTIGHMGCYSFHETKNLISGEGGAILINDDKFVERAEIIWEKGTDRSKYFRGEVDKYSWMDIGSSFLPSELVAAFLYAQLEEADKINDKRLSIWNAYYVKLKPLADAGKLRLPIVPDYCGHNAHMFYILLPNVDQRDDLIKFLEKQGITSVFHYIPLHTAPMGRQVQPVVPELPVTDNLSSRLLRLPMFYELNQIQVSKICNFIYEFVEHNRYS
ncbi:MAG: dTDP-4-amino-4,6-dideoxygalactose transaminase [Kiritimatiellae bacterium]|jgi:dTDP-4-amino-4,6-dideoxygalactose transaminase|nr:dTDP-4-amino-4,6-dideoxygalactose transaminase [Kiritimatiellia bacterium]